MSLRDGVLVSGVTGRPLFGAERTLTRHPALQLLPDFLTSALLERIRATACKNYQTKRDQNGQRSHRLMIESERRDASARRMRPKG